MSSDAPPDLSKACWRCKHWGGFAHGGATHSLCTRPCACPVQASPSTGCASWTPGDGNRHPDGWAPVGFKNPRAKDPIAEHRAPISTPPPPRPQIDSRPAGRSEGLVFDQKCEAQAWRATDALLGRMRSSL